MELDQSPSIDVAGRIECWLSMTMADTDQPCGTKSLSYEPLAKLHSRSLTNIRSVPQRDTELRSFASIWLPPSIFEGFHPLQASRWRSRPCGQEQDEDATNTGALRNETHHLQHREAEYSEHLVTHHFFWSAHTHVAASMIVFQSTVDAFGRAAFAIAHIFRHPMPDQALPLRLLRQFLLQSWRPARIDVDDRHMTESAAMVFDLRDMVGAIHQIVEVGDPRCGHGGERNGNLAIMHGRCCEHASDGDLTVGGVDVQLIAGPAFLVPLGIPLGADIAVTGQFRQHRGQAHAELAFDPARRFGGSDISLAWAAALAFGLFDRRGPVRFRWLLARFDRRAVAGDMPDQAIRMGLPDQRFVQPGWQGAGRKGGEGPRKRSLAGHLTRALPATQAA